jgi:hypothetical protein
LIYVRAAEFSLVVQLVFRVDRETGCGASSASFDEDVGDHASVGLAGRCVQDDGAVRALILNAHARPREQRVYEAEHEHLEEPVHVDQERETVRRAGDEHVSRTQPVQDQPRKGVWIPVVFVESVVRHRISDPLQVEIVRAARLPKNRKEPPDASANRIVRNARRASAQCGCQKLVLGDVLLVLVKPADETVYLPESSEHLVSTEQSPSQHWELVLAFDVVGEKSTAEDQLRTLREQKRNEVEQAGAFGM